MKLQSLSIFSLLLLLTACSVRENDLWLQKAEQFYADKQIDSTLTYLNRIIPEKLEGEDVYTYWRIQFSTSPQPFIRHSAEKIEKLTQHYEKTKDTIGPKFNPFFIPKMIADIAAGHISMMYGFRGPNFATVSACASSTNAIADAFNYIRLGKANAIVTGGAEAAIAAPGLGGFNAMNALSTRNESPETASRPFSASRDGFVMGEGAACLILEEMEHALARGAKIYGEIVGAGMSADAYHLTASHPEGLGAKLVMKNALEDAEMKPEEIDYINVHGTSTPVGDISEAKAILDVFGEHAYKLNISSTKSMTGHLLGAAGALEAIACIMAVNEDIVPPTINHEEGDNDPEIDYNLNFTFNKAQKRTVNAALSNTFGFGGHNASMIVKKFVK